MAGPNVQNTEHPLYGGGNPDYMGVAGGSMGFFQDPYGATFVGFISGTTLTITISGSGSVVAGATINGAGVTAGTTISALGTALGGSGSNQIGTYTVNNSQTVALSNLTTSPTAVLQPSGANQAAVSQSAASATATGIYSVALTPTGTATITTASQALTCTGAPIAASDFLIVNKITAQAGLGISGVRAGTTAAVAVVDYVNLTAGTLTATASESYLFADLRGVTSTVTLSPAAVLANSTLEQVFTVTGVAVGMLTAVNKPTTQAGLGIAGSRVFANNQLAITFINATAATITPTAAEAYLYMALNGLNSSSNIVLLGAQVGTPAGVVLNTTTEQAITVTGAVLASDIVVGVSKPTAQTGLGIVGYRVSAASVLGITFINATGSTITPTGSEVYAVTLLRSAPVAPLTLYSASFAPTAVAINTTGEQAMTVTGVVANTVVWVNKPSFTAGIGIVGCRVSATNVVGVLFANPTATTITPPAETYIVGNFGPTVPVNNYITAQVALAQVTNVNLSNAMRAALGAPSGGGLNLIAGA